VIADHARRASIIAMSCAIWSVFTIACGFATSFWQLAMARTGVGIGEAGCAPASYSIISDIFPPGRRGVALATFSLGLPVGLALGGFVGGEIASSYGWRMAFIMAGAPGIVLAAFAYIALEEPHRGRFDQDTVGAAKKLGESISLFVGLPVTRRLGMACAVAGFSGYGMLNWIPSYLMRAHDMKLSQVATYYSISLGSAMVVGTFLSGAIADWAERRRPGTAALVPAGAFLLAFPLFIAGFCTSHWPLAVCLLSLGCGVMQSFLAPSLLIVQNNSEIGARAAHSAMLLLVINLIGLGGGPLFVGIISDLLKISEGAQSLQWALLSLTTLLPAASFLFWRVARTSMSDLTQRGDISHGPAD
jgi:MFS family permease